MKIKAGSQEPRNPNKTKRPVSRWKIVTFSFLGLILLFGILAGGYFGVKTMWMTQRRRAGMTAYENGDYVTAERLLRRCVEEDRNDESAFVALADIYHEFGDAGSEAQMWQMANFLDPQREEYREKMLTSAVKSASYGLLHGVLMRKAWIGEKLSDQELYLYVISSYRSGYPKDADDAYKKAVDSDPEAFHKSDLGRMAEYMAICSTLVVGERGAFLADARRSEDPVVRYEAIMLTLNELGDMADDEEIESLLNELVDANYYSGIPRLADFYFSRYRFDDVLAVGERYLETIDEGDLDLMYAESCVFAERPDVLKKLETRLRGKTGYLRMVADYCGMLSACLDDDEKRLIAAVRKSDKTISSPLSRFLRLRVAVLQDSFNEIMQMAGEIFSNPPFYDLSEQACLLCMDYLVDQMTKPENQSDPSQIVALSKILAGYLRDNRFLTDIIVSDQYKRGLTRESELLEVLAKFPDDALLIDIAAKILLLGGKAEDALDLIEKAVADGAFGESGVDDISFDALRMQALEQLERYDDAAEVIRMLVEKSGFDLTMLYRYFDFCRGYDRFADLSSMANELENAENEAVRPYACFFRAAVLLADKDDAKKRTAQELLATSPDNGPEFAFYAANRLYEAGLFDEAEAKYKAILKTYSQPELVYVNLSETYKAKGEQDKAIEAAKEAYNIGLQSRITAFTYGKRLYEVGKLVEAAEILNFPRRAVDYPVEIVDIWVECMKAVIEKSIRDRRFLQAEEQCKHLLIIAPNNEFGKEKLNEVREILFPKTDNAADSGENGVF